MLADDDLLPEDVRRHLGGHLDSLQLVLAELGLAVAAHEEDVGMERLAFGHGKPLDPQALALADAVLLATE